MARHDLNDTIAAVSSPPGRSLRGLVRIAGPGTAAILAALTGETLPPPRQLVAARLTLDAGSPPLACLVARFAGPASYTGDDLAELQVPGNPALLGRVLHRVLDLGARLAEPGEFTFRAFAAGKIDLTQAEGVAATIAAVSDAQLQAASLLREGSLGRLARDLADALADLLAAVEAGIDFTDQDDVVTLPPQRLAQGLADLAGRLDGLLASCRSWGRLDALPRVVLVGPPSVGKSTLFNALLGRTRSVVSPVPGTTRDILIEPVTLPSAQSPGTPVPGSNIEILLIDIAGLDSPQSALDRQIQESAHHAIAQADLVLQLLDASPTPTLPLPTAAVILLQPKSDLPGLIPIAGALPVSAHTGRGLPELRRAIAERLADRATDLSGQTLALQPRHEAAFRAAAEHIAGARRLIASQGRGDAILRPELVASSLRAALDDLAHLAGHMTPDDVIGRVFAKFCIGK